MVKGALYYLYQSASEGMRRIKRRKIMKLVQLNCKAAKSNMVLGDKKCRKDDLLCCLKRSLPAIIIMHYFILYYPWRSQQLSKLLVNILICIDQSVRQQQRYKYIASTAEAESQCGGIFFCWLVVNISIIIALSISHGQIQSQGFKLLQT